MNNSSLQGILLFVFGILFQRKSFYTVNKYVYVVMQVVTVYFYGVSFVYAFRNVNTSTCGLCLFSLEVLNGHLSDSWIKYYFLYPNRVLIWTMELVITANISEVYTWAKWPMLPGLAYSTLYGCTDSLQSYPPGLPDNSTVPTCTFGRREGSWA